MGNVSRRMDQEQFVNQYASQQPGPDLITLGPATAQVYTHVLHADDARSIIATLFWQAFIVSEACDRTLNFLGVSPQGRQNARQIIVPRPALHRYDLLVYDSTIPSSFQPRYVDLDTTLFPMSELMIGANRVAQLGLLPDTVAVCEEVMLGALGTFGVLIAGAPKYEQVLLPGSALRVSVDGRPHPITRAVPTITSTAGIVVKCLKDGWVGVTAAFHAVGTMTNEVKVDDQNGTVNGTVSRFDHITDSVLIKLQRMPVVNAIPTKGIMAGMTPRAAQPASFIGAKSGRRGTTIKGWDAIIPSPSKFKQACVYTKRDAQPGDSGAALLTDDEWIVGFAFERSRSDELIEECRWIWADSVRKALEVALL